MSDIPIATNYRVGLFGPKDMDRLNTAVQRPGLSKIDCSVLSGISGNLTIDISRDSIFEIAPTGDTTITVTGLAGGTDRATSLIRLEQGGLYTIDWLVGNTGTMKWDGHFEPFYSSAWTILNALYVRRSLNVSAQELNPQGFDFRSDGTRLFVLGSTADSVFQYNLSTAWDITTATYSGTSFSVFAQESVSRTVKFGSAGSKMYVAGITNATVYEYNLATAWNVGTATVSASSLSVLAQEASPQDIAFSTDGTRLYVVGATGTVLQYILSTPWVVSGATFDNVLSIATVEQNPGGITFRPDGSRMYISGPSGFVNQYALSTPWDIATATLVHSFSTASEDPDGQAVMFRNDGRRMFVLGNDTDAIYEYILPFADHFSLKQIGFDTIIAKLEMREY